MSRSRETAIFKHLRELYAGQRPDRFRKRRRGPPVPPDRRWAREVLDALLRRPKGGK